VDTLAVLADLRRAAHHVGAQVDARTGVLVAALIGRTGLARAPLRHAVVAHALVAVGAGELAGRAQDRAAAFLAAEPRRADRVRVGHASAVVVEPVADLGAGQHATLADEAARAAADQVARLASADADLGLV